MAAPTRFLSGLTQAASYQPLGHIGIPDPFFYAYYEDDFIPYNASLYTVTAATGSVAADVADGSGGRIKLANTAVASDFVSVQVPGAGFQYTLGKKLAYLARVRISSTNTSVRIGMLVTTATPFAAFSDGIYFTITAGTVTLNVVSGSTSIGSVVVGTITYGTDADLGFYIDRLGNIKAFCGSNLEGVKRPNTANLGPNATINNSSLTGAISTSALFTPTLSVITTNSTVQSLVADFQFAGVER